MTKRTRYFLMGSVAFLVVGLAAGLFAYYGGIPGASAAAGPNELRYVPGDAVVVAYADVQSLKVSRFRHELKRMEPSDSNDRDEFQEATGIDVERDVDYVVAGLLAGAAGGAGVEKSGFVLAKGRFDRTRIESFIQSHGGTVQTYRGKRLYLGPGKDVQAVATEGDERHHFDGALAFLDNEVVTFGSQEGVKRIIDLQFDGKSVIAGGELYDLIKDVENGNAWAVGRFDMLTQNGRIPEELASRIPPITWFAATGHVNGGVSGTLSVEAKDAEAANNLEQVVNGFMALAKLQAGGTNARQAEMAAMVNSLRVEKADKRVSVSFSLPAEALELFKPKTQGR